MMLPVFSLAKSKTFDLSFFMNMGPGALWIWPECWPEVAVHVEVDGERVPVGDQEPLADVKLAVVDQQGPLYKGN